MPTATANLSVSVGGISVQGVISRQGEGQISQQVSVPAADAGSLTTRTSDTAGTLTMNDANHGISTGDVIDIFWTDTNGDLKCAYGATVGTVTGTSVPFSGASGDVLPAQDTSVTADVQVEIDTDFDGDNVKLIAAMHTRNGRVQFQDSTPTILKQQALLANEPWWWFDGSGSNPLAGNPVDKVIVTNADSQNASTFKLGVLYDSVA